MHTKELIGKKIQNLKNKFQLTGKGKELEASDGLIELETGELFKIPHHDARSLKLVQSPSLKHSSIFNDDPFLKRIFNRIKYNNRVAKRNKANIKGQKIIALYRLEEADDSTDINSIEGRIIIEVESGYLISEIGIDFFATGNAGIHVYPSKAAIEKEYEQKLIKLQIPNPS